MSANYDNWEKLVGAVLKRELLRQLALSHSRDSSSISDESSRFSFSSSSRFDHQLLVRKGQSRTHSFVPDDNPFDDYFIWKRQDNQEAVSGLGKSVFLPGEARELIIRTEDKPERQLPYSMSRFNDAVEVNSVLRLDIRGKITTRLLTSNTIYGAYLVFTFDGKFTGFESMKAMIRFVEHETEADAERRADIVCLQPGNGRERETMTVRRADEWLEVQIGSFYVDEGDGQAVEARLVETSCWKTGLLVQGIEFRPLASVKRV